MMIETGNLARGSLRGRIAIVTGAGGGGIRKWHTGIVAQMKVSERVQVRAYKSDGTCYRWWHATVEAVEEGRIVVVAPVGHRVDGTQGAWVSDYAIRTTYWLNRWYSLLEVYSPDGRLVEIYVNIGSPVEIEDSGMRFTDYELDVSRKPPQGARIVDEDEFLEAASKYGYSKELQQACYRAAKEAVAVANGWVAKGMPKTRA